MPCLLHHIGRMMHFVPISVAVAASCSPWVALAAGEAGTSAGSPPAPMAARVAALPEVKELPDPFTFADGSKVKSREDWGRRRKELVDLVVGYEYGALPPASEVKAQPVSKHAATQPSLETATEEEITLTMGPKGEVMTKLILTIPPTTAEHKPPFPVIVRGDLCWGRVPPASIKAVMDRGYVLAEFDRTMIAADKAGRGNGVYLAYPDFDGGDLSAWAWGFHRVTDYLLTRPDIDGKKVIDNGLSRGGKAALLAGALDERVAITAPCSSGAGGAGCYRVFPPKTEDLAALEKRFPYWFEPKLKDFVGYVDRLPIDQHELKALVAPRALIETSGMADVWANNPGTQATYVAAAEVYSFLGVPEKIGIHWREGKHEQNLIDWTAILDFADWQFYGKTPVDKFNSLAFPEQAKVYSWKAPS